MKLRTWNLGLMALAVVGTRTALADLQTWGSQAGGVRIRAVPVKHLWKADEKPEVKVDLMIGGGPSLAVARIPYCEIEVDGARYAPVIGQPVAGYTMMHPGESRKPYAAVTLAPERWSVTEGAGLSKLGALTSDPAKRLRVAPGKHRLRVLCSVGSMMVASNEAEIEVTPQAGKCVHHAGHLPRTRTEPAPNRARFGARHLFQSIAGVRLTIQPRSARCRGISLFRIIIRSLSTSTIREPPSAGQFSRHR
jgi:hypothetical protein